MKKLITASFFCSASFFCISQVDATLAPIGLLWGDFSLSADYCFNENLSAEFGAGFGSRTQDSSAFDQGYTSTNLNFQGSVKYYFSPNQGGDGVYAGGFLRSINRNIDYSDNLISSYDQSRIGAGVLLGTKRVSYSGFVFDINLGAGRAFFDETTFEDEDGGSLVIDWPDLMITGRLGLGYRF